MMRNYIDLKTTNTFYNKNIKRKTRNSSRINMYMLRYYSIKY